MLTPADTLASLPRAAATAAALPITGRAAPRASGHGRIPLGQPHLRTALPRGRHRRDGAGPVGIHARAAAGRSPPCLLTLAIGQFRRGGSASCQVAMTAPSSELTLAPPEPSCPGLACRWSVSGRRRAGLCRDALAAGDHRPAMRPSCGRWASLSIPLETALSTPLLREKTRARRSMRLAGAGKCGLRRAPDPCREWRTPLR